MGSENITAHGKKMLEDYYSQQKYKTKLERVVVNGCKVEQE